MGNSSNLSANTGSKLFSTRLFLLSLFIVIVCLNWFQLLTPKMENIQIVHPNLQTDTKAPSSIVIKDYNPNESGLFWLQFTTRANYLPSWMMPQDLRLRTLSCLNTLSTNGQDWTLPSSPEARCNNERGMALKIPANTFSKTTTWNLSGDSFGGSFGFYLDKDWSSPQLLVGLFFLCLALCGILYATLPLPQDRWKIPVIAVFLLGFLLRFWTTQVAMPPEMYLFSDMSGYFQRGVQMLRGSFNLGQTFQPIGYTLYTLVLRILGDWELLKWTSIFVSLGTALLAYLLVLKNFGKTAALLTLLFVCLDAPQVGFTARHMAESPYSFLIMLTLWWIMKALESKRLKDYFLVGVLLMVSFYFKGNHAFFIPAFSLWLLYRERDQYKIAFKKVGILAMGCFIVMLPHLAFTKFAYNQFQWGPTAGALNFVEGKCPSKNNADSAGASWMSPLFVTLKETTFKKWDRPFTDQAYFWKAGADCVKENPWVMAESLRYINYLFYGNSTWPVAGSPIDFLYKIWAPIFEWGLLPLAVIGALSYSRRRNDLNEVCALMALTIFFTVYIFKSENRFRVPFDGLFLMWSSLGIVYCGSLVTAAIRALTMKRKPLSEIT
ncbi:glycosyltransferase family 39 protein [Bdellovibrio sp. SKB1291214]|uniref:ArnT family glycosyltransferase n=1 Tax=Bdellovibrio sp. SKB1291214 TaxID=1732569 RepID=UPI000B518E23|nr:glycosyltransferase family 39 protein [Bdellovibrio sp. SKB1291214]UYL07730.1 glycosyltransferase family 39 protein [Bdellovibrio sp. SKB1291214]